MIVGVPREVMDAESRVALTPAGVRAFRHEGHDVLVQRDAGSESGFSNQQYEREGAEIIASPEELFARSRLILKVKEPLEEEYERLDSGHILFTFLHLAPKPELTRLLVEKELIAVGYETVQKDNGALPLLRPMSEVAGKMATQVGFRFLERPQGGRGILLGGVSAVPPGTVIILGGGTVGTNAAKVALGAGARVVILDIDLDRLRYLEDIFSDRVETLKSNDLNIERSVGEADLLVGAVLKPGARTPQLVSESMVESMTEGSVIVDVAIDQGGSIETCDQTGTHQDPTYMRHGVVHYTVPNMPGAVPRTSTFALESATLPYALKLAREELGTVLQEDDALRRGVNVAHGSVTHTAVAESHGLDYTPVEEVIAP